MVVLMGWRSKLQLMKRGCRNSPTVPMKIIAWNCHGLRNNAIVHGLLNVQKEDPDILFLSKTKMDRARIQGFRLKLGLTNMMSKDCYGKCVGLAIFWRLGIDLHVR